MQGHEGPEGMDQDRLEGELGAEVAKFTLSVLFEGGDGQVQLEDPAELAGRRETSKLGGNVWVGHVSQRRVYLGRLTLSRTVLDRHSG